MDLWDPEDLSVVKLENKETPNTDKKKSASNMRERLKGTGGGRRPKEINVTEEEVQGLMDTLGKRDRKKRRHSNDIWAGPGHSQTSVIANNKLARDIVEAEAEAEREKERERDAAFWSSVETMLASTHQKTASIQIKNKEKGIAPDGHLDEQNHRRRERFCCLVEGCDKFQIGFEKRCWEHGGRPFNYYCRVKDCKQKAVGKGTRCTDHGGRQKRRKSFCKDRKYSKR